MKTLREHMIIEMAIFTKEELCQIFGVEVPGAKLARFADDFVAKFLSKIKKEYSVSNKQDIGYLWNMFMDSIGKIYPMDLLKKYHCSNSKELAAILGDNLDIINHSIGKNYIKSITEKRFKELKKWKESDEYSPLDDYDPKAEYPDDEERGRAFVVYYAYDPSDTELVKVYYVNGKTTDPNTKHEMNLHRADWSYEHKLGYYHANTCTVEFYRSSGKEELEKQYVDDFDE